MNTHFIFNRFRRSRHIHISCLIVLWATGLILGILLYVRFLQDIGMDFACLFFLDSHNLAVLSVGIPIVLTALAVYFNCYLVCYPLFLTEAISRGFSAAVIFSLVGNAAWLLRSVLLFTGIGTSVVMWRLLFQCYMTTARAIRTVSFSIGLICVINFFVILPLLNGLSIYF